MAEGQPHSFHRDRSPDGRVADKGQALHAAAGGKAVAVQKDVVADGAPVDTGKNIGADAAIGFEEIRSRQRGFDARRPVIIGHVEADARHRADIDIIVHIADGRAVMRFDIGGEAQYVEPRQHFHRAVIGDQKCWLVTQLVMPAHRFAVADDAMHEGLRFLGQRCWPHHAQLNLQLVKLSARIGDQADGAIEKSGIGPRGQRRVRHCDIARRVDVLADGIAGAHLAVLGEERQHAGKTDRPAQIAVRRRGVGKLHPVGVVAVGVEKEVVLEQDVEGAALFPIGGALGVSTVSIGQHWRSQKNQPDKGKGISGSTHDATHTGMILSGVRKGNGAAHDPLPRKVGRGAREMPLDRGPLLTILRRSREASGFGGSNGF